MLVLLDVCCRVLVLQHVWNVILDTLKLIKDNVSPFLVISPIVSTAPIILHAKFVRSATHSIQNWMYVIAILLLLAVGPHRIRIVPHALVLLVIVVITMPHWLVVSVIVIFRAVFDVLVIKYALNVHTLWLRMSSMVAVFSDHNKNLSALSLIVLYVVSSQLCAQCAHKDTVSTLTKTNAVLTNVPNCLTVSPATNHKQSVTPVNHPTLYQL